MKQIDRRTPMPKRDFNKVTKQIHTSAWVFSYKFAAYFPNIFVLEHLLMAASGVASYELRVAIYCTSYVLLFTYELRVITYCTIYELIFTYELRVTIYCTSWDCYVDCAKFLYYISYSFLGLVFFKIKYF